MNANAAQVRRHLAAVDANLSFADRLVTAPDGDHTTNGWAVTATFYAAVHEVRGYLLARHGVTLTAHKDMRDVYDRHPEVRKVRADYDQLKQQSENARYYLTTLFRPEDVRKFNASFHRIRAMLRPRTDAAMSGERP